MGNTGVLCLTKNSQTLGANTNSTLSRCRYHVPAEHLWHGCWQIASQSIAFRKKFTMHQTFHIEESSQHFLGFLPDLLTFGLGDDFFCCDDFFFFVWLVAINPHFIPCNNSWQKGGVIFRMLLQFAPCYCRRFHSVMKAEVWLHCRAPRSWRSQPAMPFSGTWHQKMLPNIRYGCHFHTVSSL